MNTRRDRGGMEELMARPLADAELDRATLEMATPLAVRHGERGSVLVMHCGGELLAIRAADIAKVVPDSPLRRVPHRSNKVFLGLCNCDGELLLCVDLEASLGLPPCTSDAPRIRVVIGSGRDKWAFKVDRVVGVVEIDQTALLPAPATVSQARAGCVTHLAQTPEGAASLIDTARLAAVFRGSVS